MRLIVISDTHGSLKHIPDILARHPHDVAFHCGDFCYPREKAPELTYVRGNCDSDMEVPEENVIRIGPLLIFQTHGHLYGVKQTPMRLRYKAIETGANLVLFGHTHEITAIEDDGILYVNPGSLLLPRSYTLPTYAVLDVEEAEKDKVKITVSFYSMGGRKQPGLSRDFLLPRAND
ncbi:metallophosphoesterase [Aneurinibacillus thermoaerophilus]|nr:metallophosphoesterase [Aneurinibacillus thermoaerophilus]MED0676359.1 metallophosphoesterase [Aneurinibacillus thermoaerophilus]MED0678871.1 metallophosphoesterase [Aneurinibacillus thermoaerophilus]MED0755911.1 metallophosphoesterase [Aneurinibacillus thermoaerophilus]MED0759765.1 metallophosphoesterase [Aneurinibacillus thermoaerophilus]MED0763071.1 metallophosphoesterase [Aneurinibacillus thermoaerophilus]